MDGYFDKYPEAALGMKMRTLKMNNESYGYGSSQDWIGGHCESWKNILPESKYNDPSIPETYHPEWYSARQICLTNEELITRNKGYDGNHPDEYQLYTNAIHTYDRAPHIYIGLPTRYLGTAGTEVAPYFIASHDGVNFKFWREF